MSTSFVSSEPSLRSSDVELFSRQMMCAGIGASGMVKIAQSRMLCVGLGGLGSTIALYLVAAGVGELTLLDPDTVERSNLHRQVIHSAASAHTSKVSSAKASCLALRPEARIVAIPDALTVHNAATLVRADYDVIVDGSDNVASRYLVNDAAMRVGVPVVSAAAVRWEGQLSVYGYGDSGPCYRCVLPQPPPAAAVGKCGDVGVMGPVPGMMGCMQALEAIKIVAQCGEVLSGRMLLFDGLRARVRVVQLRARQPNCVACGGVDRVQQRRRKSSTSNGNEYVNEDDEERMVWPAFVDLVSERPEYLDGVSCSVSKVDSTTQHQTTTTTTTAAAAAASQTDRPAKADQSPASASAQAQVCPAWRCCSASQFAHVITRGRPHALSTNHTHDCVREEEEDKGKTTRAATSDPSRTGVTSCDTSEADCVICVDVRDAQQYDMAHLPHTRSLPLEQLEQWHATQALSSSWSAFVRRAIAEEHGKCAAHAAAPGRCVVYVLCRRGQASQKACALLHPVTNPSVLNESGAAVSEGWPETVELVNVNGGLTAYHNEVDSMFPLY